MSKGASKQPEELLDRQMGQRVLTDVLENTDPENHIHFGKFMGIRTYGQGPHMCLSSEAPGNDGFTQLVIYREDVPRIAAVFAALSEHVQAQVRDERAAAKELDKNGNMENRESAG